MLAAQHLGARARRTAAIGQERMRGTQAIATGAIAKGQLMRVPEESKSRFEELDEQRRRVDDEFNLLTQELRSGSRKSDDRIRIEAQQLHVRHQGIIREMIDLLVP